MTRLLMNKRVESTTTHMKFAKTYLLIMLSLLLSVTAKAASAEQANLHHQWHSLVSQHVKSINNGHSTQVDYAAFSDKQTMLDAYLDTLSHVKLQTFQQWSPSKQLAFLMNAYNAWTVKFILSEYPNLDSIKDLGRFFSSPWSKKFIPLLGKQRSLDDIEHKLIRGDNKYGDPRIHFAVNCASIGCPALREEAYTEANLEHQLTQQTIRFLTDKSRNKFEKDTMELSSIFKWYGDDFELGFRNTKSVAAFILLYKTELSLTPAQQQLLQSQDMDIDYFSYDWTLNDVE